MMNKYLPCLGTLATSRRRLLARVGAAGAAVGLRLGPAGVGRASSARGPLLVGDGEAGIPSPAPGEVGRVAVVGAGVAGLTAARALRLAGVDVVVVEGRDQVGGRIHTVDVGGTPVDLGAAWIHDGDASAMLPLLDALGVARLPAESTELTVAASVLDRTAGRFPADRTRAEIIGALEAFTVAAGDLAASEANALDVDEALHRVAPDISAAARNAANGLLSTYDGEETSRLGLANFAAFFLGVGLAEEDVFPSGGYRTLVDALAEGLDVRTGTTVEAIVEHRDGVTLLTGDGEVPATHAVVTVPLGVLKAGSIAFDPPLPHDKRAAIERMGFGAFEKVALAYPRAVWQVDGPTHLIVADAARRAWPLVLDLSAWYGEPVVAAITCGDHARAVAAMPEADRVAEVHAVVREIGGPDTPAPTAFASSAWTTDPLSRGCYSSIARAGDVDGHFADLTALAAPAGRILFAGEATSAARPATVDGAWLSGIREAKRLLQAPMVRIL